jgi:hypothetical protein
MKLNQLKSKVIKKKNIKINIKLKLLMKFLRFLFKKLLN